jgi:hypothetical protein
LKAATVLECLAALGIATSLLLAGLVRRCVPPVWLLQAGALSVALASVGSCVAGIFYHLALYRALHVRLPKRWWLSPTRYHGLLSAAQRQRVLPWFHLGAAAFVLVVLGALVTLAAALGDL